MKADPPERNGGVAETAGVLARWMLGALFVYMGLSKALHPVDFLKLIRQYDLVQSAWLLNSIAATLPWFEVFCGLLLLAGIAVRGSALVLVGMLVPFTIVLFRRALALQSIQAIPFCAVKFDCGCGNGEVFICWKLLENGLLLLLAAWLVSGRGSKLCLRYGML
jgi:putative oxidoreductase